MLYNPSTGSIDPNAPYVGKNVAAGTQGSKVPAAAIEGAQREIVAAIVGAGLNPSNADLGQLLKAIKALARGAAPEVALLHNGVDTGNVNAIVANAVPAITEYTAGFVYVIRAHYAPTGETTARIGGLGNRSVVRADGTPIQAGDWGADEMIALVDDGTSLGLQGVKTSFIPARNLLQYTVAGTYTFTVPTGIYWVFGEVVGGGAGGGAAAAWSSGGGASGGYAAGWIAVVPGQIITLTVGAKGLGGGTSSIGPYMQASGGEGGTGGFASSGGGVAGLGSGGQKNLYGSCGGDGNITTPTAQGGASAFGGGGRTSTIDNASTAGLAPGSGGGGIWGTASGAQTGGPGAPGAIFLSY